MGSNPQPGFTGSRSAGPAAAAGSAAALQSGNPNPPGAGSVDQSWGYPPYGWWPQYNYYPGYYGNHLPPPPPPPPPPPHRSSKKDAAGKDEGSSEYSLSDGELLSEDEELTGFAKLQRLIDMDDDGSYGAKVDLAAKVLEKDLGASDEAGPSLTKRKGKKDWSFPWNEVLQKHFEASWMSVMGTSEFKEEDDDICAAPAGAVGVGKWPRSKLLPKLRWYKTKDNPGWPMSSLKMDSNVEDLIPKWKSDPNSKFVDECMDLQGKGLSVLNQFMFFTQASSQLVESLDDDIPEGLRRRWTALMDFMTVQCQSLEDLAAVSTNAMVTMLLEKRFLGLNKANLSQQEKRALKFVSPIDKANRLYSGRLGKFWKERERVRASKRTEQMISILGNKRRRSRSPERSSGKKARISENFFKKQSGYKGKGYQGKKGDKPFRYNKKEDFKSDKKDNRKF